MSAAGEGSAAAGAAEELRRRIASAGLLPGERLGDAKHLTHLGITDLAASPELTRVMSSVLARTRLAFHPLDEQTRLHALFADRNRWIVARLLAEDLPAVRAMFGDYLEEAEAFVLQHLDGSAVAQVSDVPA